MKVTTALTTIPSRPTSLYSKSSIKRNKNSPTFASSSSSSTSSTSASSSSSSSSSASSSSHTGGSNSNRNSLSSSQITKKKDSPLRQSIRRTPPELLAIELKKLKDSNITVGNGGNQDFIDLLEVEYRDDIKNWLFFMEEKTCASVELIDLQPEVKWYMRPYLVDFLVEIHFQLRLRPETLYLALNIVDRYVSKRIVFKKHYQLVGCVGLWIASKFEDAKDRVPSLPDLASACSGAYDESAFVQMEQHILASINWVVGHPTTESWLRLACVTKRGVVEDKMTQNLARFLMEITLFYKEFLEFKSSQLAVAALVLARFILGRSRRVMDESVEVLSIVALLDSHFGERIETVSATVVKKYSPVYFSKASTYCLEWYLSGKRFGYHTATPSPQYSFTPSLLFSNTASPSSASSSASSLNVSTKSNSTSITSSPVSSIFSNNSNSSSCSSSSNSIRSTFDSPAHNHHQQQVQQQEYQYQPQVRNYSNTKATSLVPSRSNSTTSSIISTSDQSSTFSYRSNSTAPSSLECSDEEEQEDEDTELEEEEEEEEEGEEEVTSDNSSVFSGHSSTSRPNSYYAVQVDPFQQQGKENGAAASRGVYGRIEKSPAEISFNFSGTHSSSAQMKRDPLSPTSFNSRAY